MCLACRSFDGGSALTSFSEGTNSREDVWTGLASNSEAEEIKFQHLPSK